MEMRASKIVLVVAALLSGCAPSNGAMLAPSTHDGLTQKASKAYKIFIADIASGTIRTYTADGTPATPTISTGNYLYSMAVAPNGKIYAVTFDPLDGPSSNATVHSYTPDGTPTKPTITIAETNYAVPIGIAVDANGKIYVLNSLPEGNPGIVTTYKPNGSPTTPTISTGADAGAIAVDSNGKVYVANDTGPNGQSSVTTYLPDGSPTTPTITKRVHRPAALAVGSDGTIYVGNTNNHGHNGTEAGYVTTYAADGSGPLRTIVDREQAPGGIAAAPDRFYLGSSSAYNGSLRTYTLGGRRVSPTISNYLLEPSAVVVH